MSWFKKYHTASNEDCPKCGYPTKGQYLGIYTPGYACDMCGYLDQIAAKEIARLKQESEQRVKKEKQNPPIFKSTADWKNYK